MRDKLIGMAVWRGGKWYLRRRVRNTVTPGRRRAAIACLSAAVLLGVLAGQRPSSDS